MYDCGLMRAGSGSRKVARQHPLTGSATVTRGWYERWTGQERLTSGGRCVTCRITKLTPSRDGPESGCRARPNGKLRRRGTDVRALYSTPGVMTRQQLPTRTSISCRSTLQQSVRIAEMFRPAAAME